MKIMACSPIVSWFWDFGGGDPSHEESGRQVAINVLLAEKVVAGSYFEVKKTK